VRGYGTNFLCVSKKWYLIKLRDVLYFRVSILSTSLSTKVIYLTCIW